jgi:hypothetical protein
MIVVMARTRVMRMTVVPVMVYRLSNGAAESKCRDNDN